MTPEQFQQQIDALRKVIVDAENAIAGVEAEAASRCIVVGEASLIIDQVSKETGIHPAAMRGPRQDRPIFLARAEAMRRIRLTNRYSLPQIGRLFGGRDHTTVLHAISRAEDELRRKTTLNRPARADVTNSSCPVTMP